MKYILISLGLLFSLVASGQISDELAEELRMAYIDHNHQPTSHLRTAPFIVKRIKLINRVELEYVEQGNETGLPVIFLHGLSDSWHSFENVLPLLPDTIRAIAITQRGHGNSQKPDQGYHPEDFAADLAAFVRQKNLNEVVIVGHSMGGVVAQQFSIKYSSLVKALVIINSDAAFSTNPGLNGFYNEVMNMNGEMSREFMAAFQHGAIGNPLDSAFFELVVNEGMKTPLYVFQETLRGIMSVDLLSQLKSIKKPVLIFWGNRDEICQAQGQNKMASEFQFLKRLVYEDIGHSLHWEAPTRFATDLMDFLRTEKLYEK